MLLCQALQLCFGCIFGQCIGNCVGNIEQVSIGNIANIIAYVFHIGLQCIIHCRICNFILKCMVKNSCNTKGQYHTYQQPTLKSLCNIFFIHIFLFMVITAIGQCCDCNNGQHNRNTVGYNHRHCANLYNRKCSMDVICIC